MAERSSYWMLDANGEAVPAPDVETWGHWYKTADRTVAQAVDEGDPAKTVRVSTVFLGLDHNFAATGPPILWETLVFGGVLDGEMRRYSSRDAALLGHQEMCNRVNATLQHPGKERP